MHLINHNLSSNSFVATFYLQYSYVVKFGEIYVTPPSVFEADGHSRELYPQEARLRSLTYASPVFIGTYFVTFFDAPLCFTLLYVPCFAFLA